MREKPEEKEYIRKCAQRFADILCENGFEANVYMDARTYDQIYARKIQAPFDYMIYLYDLPFPMNLGDTWSTQLMPMHKKVGISFSSPYLFDDYFSREKTYIQMNSRLTIHSAEAAAYAVLGTNQMTGKLRVKMN